MALDLFAGIRVRDYQAAKSWYERLLGREPAFFPNATEAVWELAEHRYVFIVEDRVAPGGANNLIWVDDLDALVAEIGSRGIEPAEREMYANVCAKWSIAMSTATSSASAALPSRGEASGFGSGDLPWRLRIHSNRVRTPVPTMEALRKGRGAFPLPETNSEKGRRRPATTEYARVGQDGGRCPRPASRLVRGERAQVPLLPLAGPFLAGQGDGDGFPRPACGRPLLVWEGEIP